jgi:hypothetical protein
MKTQEKAQKCRGCKFFQPVDLPNFYGECRRYPPVWRNGNNGTDWPDVDEKSWCGEFWHIE